MFLLLQTSKGLEGIHFSDGVDCLIADNTVDFADAMIKLSNDLELQKILVHQANDKMKKCIIHKKCWIGDYRFILLFLKMNFNVFVEPLIYIVILKTFLDSLHINCCYSFLNDMKWQKDLINCLRDFLSLGILALAIIWDKLY